MRPDAGSFKEGSFRGAGFGATTGGCVLSRLGEGTGKVSGVSSGIEGVIAQGGSYARSAKKIVTQAQKSNKIFEKIFKKHLFTFR